MYWLDFRRLNCDRSATSSYRARISFPTVERRVPNFLYGESVAVTNSPRICVVNKIELDYQEPNYVVQLFVNKFMKHSTEDYNHNVLSTHCIR